MEKKVDLIVAPSGTGKDYSVDFLCKYFGFKKVISRTTRKPRYEGEDTHIFVTYRQGRKDFNRKDVIAKTIYNKEKYYTLPEDLIDKDFYIIDVQGVMSMDKNKYDKIIFIKPSIFRRFLNMRKRRDSFKNILTRLMVDRKEFKGFKGDLNFKNSNEFIDYMVEEQGKKNKNVQ